MHVLIPCKGLDSGKSRLAGCIGPAARRQFCERLLHFTLRQALAVAGRDKVRLLAADRAARELAAFYSIGWLDDPGGGLNNALEHGRTALASQAPGMEALMIWPIDLPFVSPEAIRDVARPAADLVLAPDRDGAGTNMLLLRAGALSRFRFAYGPGSCQRHLDTARRADLNVARFDDWRLAFDVDAPQHYLEWLDRCSAGPGPTGPKHSASPATLQARRPAIG